MQRNQSKGSAPANNALQKNTRGKYKAKDKEYDCEESGCMVAFTDPSKLNEHYSAKHHWAKHQDVVDQAFAEWDENDELFPDGHYSGYIAFNATVDESLNDYLHELFGKNLLTVAAKHHHNALYKQAQKTNEAWTKETRVIMQRIKKASQRRADDKKRGLEEVRAEFEQEREAALDKKKLPSKKGKSKTITTTTVAVTSSRQYGNAQISSASADSGQESDRDDETGRAQPTDTTPARQPLAAVPYHPVATGSSKVTVGTAGNATTAVPPNPSHGSGVPATHGPAIASCTLSALVSGLSDRGDDARLKRELIIEEMGAFAFNTPLECLKRSVRGLDDNRNCVVRSLDHPSTVLVAVALHYKPEKIARYVSTSVEKVEDKLEEAIREVAALQHRKFKELRGEVKKVRDLHVEEWETDEKVVKCCFA